ncbi:hypothetical protein BB561_003525 [Smittium simulii]|uniref:Polynucleotide kinase 3'-phosphatase n=1 Tax=Smittium simulii TaxID=133385 RepID=A0A2T9YKX3_9FUNG|nr:hypothetical protein BB561_003525 [Smittium simulii]
MNTKNTELNTATVCSNLLGALETKSQTAPNIKWFENENILVAKDGTLIRTKSKSTMPKDGNDWIFAFPKVPEKIKQLAEQEYHISILSNQKGLFIQPGQKNPKKELLKTQLKHKITTLANQLGISFWFFAAKTDDIFRKPRIGMWLLMALHANNSIDIDTKSSFYVGDALGRPKGWMSAPTKDFADTDLKFALNVGIDIKVPELFFETYNSAPPIPEPIHCKQLVTDKNDLGSIYDGGYSDFISTITSSIEKNEKFVVVMIGSPASGKSSFVLDILVNQYGLERVNQDTLVTFKKCLDLTNENLKLGKNIVIDNTNGPKQTRANYIRLSKEYKYKVYCAHKYIQDEIIAHNNNYRAVSAQLKSAHDWIKTEENVQKFNQEFKNKELQYIFDVIPKPGNFVSRIVYNTYKSRYEAPSKAEGFDAVFVVPFTPSFKSQQDELLWNTWLC